MVNESRGDSLVPIFQELIDFAHLIVQVMVCSQAHDGHVAKQNRVHSSEAIWLLRVLHNIPQHHAQPYLSSSNRDTTRPDMSQNAHTF